MHMSVHKKVSLFTGDHEICAVSMMSMGKNWKWFWMRSKWKRFKFFIKKLNYSYLVLFPLMSGEIHCDGTEIASHGDFSSPFSIYFEKPFPQKWDRMDCRPVKSRYFFLVDIEFVLSNHFCQEQLSLIYTKYFIMWKNRCIWRSSLPWMDWGKLF